MSVISDVREYNALRTQKSLIEKRMKELGDKIKSYSVDNGVKDQNGSSSIQEGGFVFGNMAKKSVKLNQEKAKSYFSEIGVLDKVIETKYEVSEDKINTLLTEGVITEDDIANVVDMKVSYSISVKEVVEEPTEEEMPVIETQTKKKPVLRKKVAK